MPFRFLIGYTEPTLACLIESLVLSTKQHFMLNIGSTCGRLAGNGTRMKLPGKYEETQNTSNPCLDVFSIFSRLI